MTNLSDTKNLPDDLKKCVEFHGHICPGLIYGYRVAREAMHLMDLHRAIDEEIVSICENDSCAIDALQVLLGTAAGKGNLIIRDYGKNAYTVVSRLARRSFRFSRTAKYEYKGKDKDRFDTLEAKFASGTASESDRRLLREMKIDDLLTQPFGDIFTTHEVPYEDLLFAPLKPSEPCAVCGEMTMASKLAPLSNGRLVCIPCLQKKA